MKEMLSGGWKRVLNRLTLMKSGEVDDVEKIMRGPRRSAQRVRRLKKGEHGLIESIEKK